MGHLCLLKQQPIPHRSADGGKTGKCLLVASVWRHPVSSCKDAASVAGSRAGWVENFIPFLV
ncbi:MAG: hypothetical protein DWI22_14465 [Planctomycetota bacterium]|nr:MAG: hypothetical protein DWI22_14465 [Planctomycetota bacterium]